jgi:hypothetical protein
MIKSVKYETNKYKSELWNKFRSWIQESHDILGNAFNGLTCLEFTNVKHTHGQKWQ